MDSKVTAGPQLVGRCILVVEDNAINQKVLRGMLTKLGASVHVVENGRLAVEAVLSRPYDAVLMDIQMPVMDGLEATRMIRSNPQLAHLPIIAVSGYCSPDSRSSAEEAGMDDFLPKPVRPVELTEALVRQLEQHGGHS